MPPSWGTGGRDDPGRPLASHDDVVSVRPGAARRLAGRVRQRGGAPEPVRQPVAAAGSERGASWSARGRVTLAALERMLAVRYAVVLRRVFAGDEAGADTRMPAALRLERAIYARLSAAGERQGAA